MEQEPDAQNRLPHLQVVQKSERFSARKEIKRELDAYSGQKEE